MKVSSETLSKCMLEDLMPFIGHGPERDWRCFAADALMSSVNKKNVDNVDREADARALKLFLEVNEGLRQSVLIESLTDEYLIGELKNELYRFWWKSGSESVATSFSQLFLAGNVGPGKSQGSEYDDMYSKLFNSQLTLTNPQLYKEYRAQLSEYPSYDAAEKCRAEYYGDYRVVGYSKLSFVPKRTDISRTVCPEPTLNMFFQLGFGSLLEERLREFYAIDLATQPDFNRELARRGSVDGSIATIDLSSASDSNSRGVFKEIAPSGFNAWVDFLRTPTVRLPDGKLVELNMVSTMGNGFTFPLETVIFSAVVAVCYRLTGIKPVRNHGSKPGNWGVFGDDILVDKKVFHKVCRLLHLLGYKVNVDKTFVEGPFRESCGSDWFQGHFVRGVYLKSLASLQDRYVAINLLNDWTAQTGISLSNSVQHLLGSVKRVFVPPSCGLDAGLHFPLSMTGAKRNRNGAYKYRFYKAVPLVDRVSDEGLVRGRGLVNPDGLIQSFLAGHIRSQCIMRRQRKVRYVVKAWVTPVWDTLSSMSVENAILGSWRGFRRPLTRSCKRINFTRWETAVYCNTYK